MTNADSNQLIEDLAYMVIEQQAPEELPFFQETSVAYFKHPQQVLRAQRGQDEKLGIGIAEVMPYMTPIVLLISQQAVTMITTGVTKSIEEEGANVVSRFLKKFIKKTKKSEPIALHAASFTSDQLLQVRKQACDTAIKLKISRDIAQLLADALIGSLIKKGLITNMPEYGKKQEES